MDTLIVIELVPQVGKLARRNVKRKRDSGLELEVNVKRTFRQRHFPEHADTFPDTLWFDYDGKTCVMWDPWMEGSFKATGSVLGNRKILIPKVLINMIQEFTHVEDQEIDGLHDI